MKEVTLSGGRLSLSVVDIGGSVTALRVPDRDGRSANVLLALPILEDYARPHPHLGTLVGRYANRIAGGRFAIDGQAFQLPCNDGANTLHGGPRGFGQRPWTLVPVSASELDLLLTSEDGDQGFPGRMEVRVRYTLTPDDAWAITYEARCDRPTVINLSQHAYFNLAGGGGILDHRLAIAADGYCTVGEDLIPREIAPVAGTPFDFRQPTAIGERIAEAHPQLRHARGYDHNWVLEDGDGLRFAARLEDPASGRTMEVHTTEPGLQFYSGNFLDGSVAGLAHRSGLCLETQHFPDAPNRPDFPSTLLRPGETFRSRTEYRFTRL